MDTDTFRLGGRFILSLFMLGLVLTGDVSGSIGVTAATITSGIDVAAFVEALKETQTDKQTRFNND
jgi:hypothetical protein